MPYWVSSTTLPATTSTVHPYLDPPPMPTPLRPTTTSKCDKHINRRTASKRPRDGTDVGVVGGGGELLQSDESDSRASSPALKYEEPPSSPFAPFGRPAWGASESQSTAPLATTAAGAFSRSPEEEVPSLLPPHVARAVPDQDPCLGGVVSLMYTPTNTSTTCSLGSMALEAGCDARDRALWWQQQHQSSSAAASAIIDGELGVVPYTAAPPLSSNKGHMPLGVRRLTGGVLTNLPVIHPTLRPLEAPQIPPTLSSRGIDSAQLPVSYVQHSPTVCYRVFVPMDHILTAFNTAIKPPTSTATQNNFASAFGRVGGDVDFISEVMRLVFYHVRVACGCGGICGELPPKDMHLVRTSAKALLPQCVYDTLMKTLPHPTMITSPFSSGPPGFRVGVHTLHTLFSFDGFSYLKNYTLSASARTVKRGVMRGSAAAAAVKDGGVGGAGDGGFSMMDDEGSNSMPMMMASDPTTTTTTTIATPSGVDTTSKLVVPFGKVAVLGQGGGIGGVMGGTSVLFDLLRVIAAEQERRSDSDDTPPPKVVSGDCCEKTSRGPTADGAGVKTTTSVDAVDTADSTSFDECWDKYIESLPPPIATDDTIPSTPSLAPLPEKTTPMAAATTTKTAATAVVAPPVSDGFVPAVFNDEWAVCSGVHITVIVGPRAGCTHHVSPQEGSLCATYPTYTTATSTTHRRHSSECTVSGCQQFEIVAVSPMYERAAPADSAHVEDSLSLQ